MVVIGLTTTGYHCGLRGRPSTKFRLPAELLSGTGNLTAFPSSSEGLQQVTSPKNKAIVGIHAL
jgi:hypothetical protein